MKFSLTVDQAKRQLLDYVHQIVSVLPPEAMLDRTGLSPDNPRLCDESSGANITGPRYAITKYAIKGLDPVDYPSFFDLVVAYWRSHGWVIRTDYRREADDYFVNAVSSDGYEVALQSNPVGGLYIMGNSPCAAVTPQGGDDTGQQGAKSHRKPLRPDSAPQVPLRHFRPG